MHRAVGFVLLVLSLTSPLLGAPSVVDRTLTVRTVVSGLVTPTGIAFLGRGEMLVLEKNTGRVLHVRDGVMVGTALDLGVNFASERGLLGIALHPEFPDEPGVYLFWSCRSVAPPVDPFVPDETTCSDATMFAPDSEDVLEVPLLGNRIDRFTWDGASLAFDHNLIVLRSFQNDAAPQPPGQGDELQPPRGNHDGGVLAFGPDGKLYAIVGDVGRRGQLQNLDTVVPDDQFGGPEPDDAHLAGMILRLNDDGTTPADNPLFAAGAAMGGEVGANVQRLFAYGIRNSFGMAFDPRSGRLWFQENGEDAFDELNLADPGLNSGWIQVMGPLARVAQFREIETTSLHHEDFPNLQQLRWGPERIAASPAEARSRLFVLPGSHYSDPEFSWKHVLAPAAIGFVDGPGLGRQYDGDLLVGVSVPEPLGGVLFHFNLTGNRRRIALDDPRLADLVADNATFHELTESESLVFGRDFGVVTDIETGPDGGVYVVSISNGEIYRIDRRTAGP